MHIEVDFNDVIDITTSHTRRFSTVIHAKPLMVFGLRPAFTLLGRNHSVQKLDRGWGYQEELEGGGGGERGGGVYACGSPD